MTSHLPDQPSDLDALGAIAMREHWRAAGLGDRSTKLLELAADGWFRQPFLDLVALVRFAVDEDVAVAYWHPMAPLSLGPDATESDRARYAMQTLAGMSGRLRNPTGEPRGTGWTVEEVLPWLGVMVAAPNARWCRQLWDRSEGSPSDLEGLLGGYRGMPGLRGALAYASDVGAAALQPAADGGPSDDDLRAISALRGWRLPPLLLA